VRDVFPGADFGENIQFKRRPIGRLLFVSMGGLPAHQYVISLRRMGGANNGLMVKAVIDADKYNPLGSIP